MFMKKIITYTAKRDSKNRVVVRNSDFDYYEVSEYENGRIVMEPRVLVSPDAVSKKSLDMMDRSVANLKKKKVGKPIHSSKLPKPE